MAYGGGKYGWYTYGLDYEPINVNSQSSGKAIQPINVNTQSSGTVPINTNISILVNTQSSGAIPINYNITITVNTQTSAEVLYEEIAALADLACYILNLDTKRTFQYANFNFTGFGRFNQKFLAVKADGVYDLETVASDDAGSNIAASMEILTDFDSFDYTRPTDIAVTMDGAQYKITVTDADSNTVNSTLTPNELRPLTATTRSMYHTLKFENVSGEQITIELIDGKVEVFKH